jgi:hypothetical protein
MSAMIEAGYLTSIQLMVKPFDLATHMRQS